MRIIIHQKVEGELHDPVASIFTLETSRATHIATIHAHSGKFIGTVEINKYINATATCARQMARVIDPLYARNLEIRING